MARLDFQVLYHARKLKARQRVEHAAALARYHHLKSFYDAGFETREDKMLFVEKHPHLAAEVFYYHRDPEIGGLLVETYRIHPRGELRILAEAVRGVLRARQARDERLEEVLGMQELPLMDEQDSEEVLSV